MLNGYVAFICTILRTTYLHIWVLGELGVAESWTKLFVVGPLPCIERPLVAGIKNSIIYLKGGTKLACFDLSTQRIEDIEVKEERIFLQTFICKENLLSFE